MRQNGNASRIAYPLIRANTYAAFARLFLSVLFGLMVSIKFDAPSFPGDHGWIHGAGCDVNSHEILYARLRNTFTAFLYYVVPLLTPLYIRSLYTEPATPGLAPQPASSSMEGMQ